ncbi:Hypothetical predicted protein [Prunus dulcis]|uniref:Uncharacterized protein n=1 Tax=Prunus dulcis TaxID=3755 RepID=A0A5E4FNL2_PRUDU|nr:Hypothetical predicted protein [Prunus dulcis]
MTCTLPFFSPHTFLISVLVSDEISDMSESLKKEVGESKKRANEIILKDMEERLKKQQEAMEEFWKLQSGKKDAILEGQGEGMVSEHGQGMN